MTVATTQASGIQESEAAHIKQGRGTRDSALLIIGANKCQ